MAPARRLRLHYLFLMPVHPPSCLSVSEMNSVSGGWFRHIRTFVCFLLGRTFPSSREACAGGGGCTSALRVIEITLMHVFLLRRKCKSFPFGQDVALGSWGGGRRSWAPAPSAESQPLQADSAGRSGRFRLSRKKISLFFTRRTAAAS